MDVNPYQPPRESDPQGKKPPVKWAIGVVAILLLTPLAVLIAGGASFTPLAVLIAGGASCAAGVAVTQVLDGTFPGNTGGAIIVGLIVFVIPPLVVLIAMTWWAVRAGKRP